MTRGILSGVGTELLPRIGHGREEARVANDNQRLDANIDDVKADLHDVKARVARIEVLLEEQNAQTALILDGSVTLLSRQSQVELRLEQLDDTLRKLVAAHAVF